MGTLIVLSSSPPRQYARSPTPATSSSPTFASPSSIFGNGPRKFKNSGLQRDGFQGRSCSTRRILGAKVGSENISFGVTKIQHTSQEAVKNLTTSPKSVAHPWREDGSLEDKCGNHLATAKALAQDGGKRQPTVSAPTKRPSEGDDKKIFACRTEGSSDSRALSPLLLDKATPRRLDWTPVKRSSENVIDLDLEATPGKTFPAGLLESFGYETASAQPSFRSNTKEGDAPTKRRRLDLADSVMRKPSKIAVAPQLAPASKNPPNPVTKRSKSQKKKYTTITGLATSYYAHGEQREREASPVLQCLAAAQVTDGGDSEQPVVDVTKRKRAAKKQNTKKKPLQTSVLLSPESAMKAIDSQETVFGSASQLARDESLEFIRDMAEAIKQSESSASCTPVPTQITIPSEPGSGRGLGTSRFIKSRNLWANASRDEDNALLQVDTIDLFDSPDLRLAFTGKDAMLQPTAPRQRESASPEKVVTVLGGGLRTEAGVRKSNGWLDIDDIGIPTPKAQVVRKPFSQTRTMHTASRRRCEGSKCLPESHDTTVGATTKNKASAEERTQKADNATALAARGSTGLPLSQMPIFGGFTTAELANQIKRYGFKPFKKREKMIEVLENCWKAQHGRKSTSGNEVDLVDASDEEPELATHVDILSNVHSLAERSTSKASKAKSSKLNKEKPAIPANRGRPKVATNDDNSLANIPKQRKKAEPKTKKSSEHPADETITRSKSEASALALEYIIDISDIEDTAIQNSNKPSLLTTTTATVKTSTTTASPIRLNTTLTKHTSTTSFKLDSATPRLSEPSAPELPDISSQITKAITSYVPSPSRDHQRNPTWHEKILMYDPIVLEDLASWLNTEGLALVGEDREVSALEVRSWCEMKGVCCYGVGGGWRGNVKGKVVATGSEVDD